MKQILYSSTRGKQKGLTASQAILKGLAEDGGLFMPDHIPAFDFDLETLVGADYRETAYQVIKLFLTDFTEEELRHCINSAYDSKFDTPEIAPLVLADGAYYLELFHGKTIAFKDMALSILPYFMTEAAKKNGVTNTIEILTATSGDTGKAAMAGFADVPGTGIFVFYPKGGVSRFQELQMVTQKGENTNVVSIHGNFDDAQNNVKKIFGDAAFNARLAEANIQLSSANSINIGRLVPQIAYYVWSWVKLRENGEIAKGEKINICVPTGNFGNILSAYFAKLMGLPVNKLICASNDNKVLFDFFSTGIYDRNREFILTTSPSMDILISSNLERLIYMSCGCDAAANRVMMIELARTGKYTVTREMKKRMADFTGRYADQQQVAARIKELYEKTGYVLDTHTGVASAAYEQYRAETGDTTKTVIAGTASPFKFSRAVMTAIRGELGEMDDWQVIDLLSETSGVPVPPAVEEIRTAEVRHRTECDPDQMEQTIADLLKL
jgi:threonine synthase